MLLESTTLQLNGSSKKIACLTNQTLPPLPCRGCQGASWQSSSAATVSNPRPGCPWVMGSVDIWNAILYFNVDGGTEGTEKKTVKVELPTAVPLSYPAFQAQRG